MTEENKVKSSEERAPEKNPDDKGAKPMTDNEAKDVAGGFPGEYWPAPQDRGWFGP